MSERAVAKSRSQTQNASRLVLSIGLLTGSLLSGMSWAQSESSNAQQWFDRIERGDIQLRQEARTPQVQRIMAQNRAEQQEQQRVTREVARESARESAREARQQASEARRAAHEARREAQEAQRVQIEAAREQLREAAKRLAEARRQGSRGGEAYSFDFQFDTDDKPRLGLVMGTSSDDEVNILSVTPDSPAEMAGLRSGDVIVAVNGNTFVEDEPQLRLNEFFRSLGELEADKAVSFSYRRDGRTQEVSVTPEVLDHTEFFPFAPNVDVESIVDGVSEAMSFVHISDDGGPVHISTFRNIRMFRDFELTELDEQLGAYFGADEGLLVLTVPDYLADQVQRGDVLLAIDGRQPQDVGHAFRILESYEPGEQVALSILRKGSREEVDMVLPEASEQEFFFRTPPKPPVPVAPVAPPGGRHYPTGHHTDHDEAVLMIRT
jgi:C-terminal processing protease CtpA/Prc